MGILIDPEDFTGRWSVAYDDYTEDEFNAYINTYEKKYLVELLGVALYDLFAADLTAQVPGTAIYLSLFNEFYIDDGEDLFHSEGMKKMLMGMIFFQFVKDQPLKNTVSGTVKNTASLSQQITPFNTVVQRWNQAVDTYQVIQWYINDNSASYPTYNGQQIQHTSGI